MKYTLTYNKHGQVVRRGYDTLAKLAHHYRLVRKVTMATWGIV